MRLAFAAASAIPASFLGLALSFPSPLSAPPALLRGVALLALILASISVATPLIAYGAAVKNAILYRNAGPLYPLFGSYFLLTFLTAGGLLVIKWKSARGLARAQVRYLALAIFFPGLAAITTNLIIPWATGSSRYSWLGPYFAGITVVIVAHAVIRHRLMSLRLVAHKALTLTAAILLSVVPLSVLIALFWPRVSTRIAPAEAMLILAAIVIASLVVNPLRCLTERFLDSYVYRSRADYKRTVANVSRALTRMLRLRPLTLFISETISEAMKPEGVAMYLADDLPELTRSVIHVHPAGSFTAPSELPAALREWLATDPRPILSEEISSKEMALRSELDRLNWALVLPVIFEDSVIGAIAIGPKLSGDPFYAHDLDLLTTLANQAGIAIKNAQLYTEVVLANEYMTNIVATIESGVISINAAGRVLMFNRAAEELTGQRAETVLGRPMAEVLPAALEQRLRTTRDTGQAHTEPELALTAGETTTPVICTTSPVRDPSGDIIGAVSVLSDLTLLKELEAQRRRAERLAYFEVLAAGLAHEIKNPLVAIKAFTQLVPRRSRDDAFIEEFSRVVSREIGRMERLVDRLRVLSRPGARPRLRLDVRGPVRDALEFLRPVFDEKQLILTADLPSEPALTVGDEAELEQLFINLLMNAREATPSGGTVAVTISEEAGAVRVAVADTGPGIPPELLSQVFEPFFTTKARGSGLGLAISSAIAESHGARIWAANREEGGAVFTVELPAPPPVDAPRPSMNPAA
jgi:two-component system NtrC family sensor kinase